MNIISPSILAADFGNLNKEIERISEAQWVHIDVMDGHFVPNISFGLPIVSAVRKLTAQVLDVHLMISNPLTYAERFVKAGADFVVFHMESDDDPKEVIRAVRNAGAKVGAAIKPGTPVEVLYDVMDSLDLALIMTVEPGFGGQSFLFDTVPKIRALRTFCNENGLNVPIQVDGGINLETAAICAQAGADALVAGSYVFASDDVAAAVHSLMHL